MADVVTYFLSETVLRLRALVTLRIDLVTGARRRVDGTWSVDALTRADVSDPRALSLGHGWLSDREVTVSLTEDGRLTTAGATSTGGGSRLLTGLVTVAGVVAGIAAPGAGLIAEPTAASAAVASERLVAGGHPKSYEAAHPDLAREAGEVRRARETLNRRLLALVANPATGPGALEAIERGAAQLDALAERLAVHRRAWEATAYDDLPAAVDVTLALSGVPRWVGELDLVAARRGDPLPAPAATGDQPEARDMAERFGVRVALHDPHRPSAVAGEVAPEPSLAYRRGREVTLLVWTDASGPSVAALRTLTVVDGHSLVGSLPLGHNVFGKRAATYGFSDAGALTSLSTSVTSGVAAVADTVAGLPAAFAGPGGALTVGSLVAALHPDAAAAQLAATVARQKQLEADIALSSDLATAGQAAELARLTQQADLLRLRGLAP